MVESFLAMFPRVHQPLRKSYLYSHCPQQPRVNVLNSPNDVWRPTLDSIMLWKTICEGRTMLRVNGVRAGWATRQLYRLVNEVNHVVVQIWKVFSFEKEKNMEALTFSEMFRNYPGIFRIFRISCLDHTELAEAALSVLSKQTSRSVNK